MNSSERFFLLFPDMLHLIIYILFPILLCLVLYLLVNLLSSLYALYIIFLVIVSNFAFTIAVYFVY